MPTTASSDDRLDRFWGAVDRKHIELIAAHVKDGSVLDLGCGFGSTTASLGAVGVDADGSALEVARRRYPAASFVEADAHALPFEDGRFGTVVLRDVLHHLATDWPAAEIGRVMAPAGRVIVLDPNITPLVRLGRKIIGHVDEECPLDQALALLREIDCRPREVSFNTIWSLPLSGGYVGPELVGNRPRLHRWLLDMETFVERRLGRFGPYLCWRYLIVAQRA